MKPSKLAVFLYMYLIQSLEESIFVLCAPRFPLPSDLLSFLLLSSRGAQVPCCWLGIPSRIVGRNSWCATRCCPSIICCCKNTWPEWVSNQEEDSWIAIREELRISSSFYCSHLYNFPPKIFHLKYNRQITRFVLKK